MKIVNRFCLTSFVVLSLAGRALAQTTPDAATRPATTNYPAVTFGVVSFLQYAAELHEQDGYNAFDVTRGYLNIQARLSDRIKRPVHAGCAADHRRQPRQEPGAAPRIRLAGRPGE